MAKFKPVDWTHERVQEILAAAYRCVEKASFEQLSMADIAREAGLSKGLLHYYFESKEHLFLELQAWVFQSLSRRIEAAVANRPKGPERALAALDQVWDVLKQRRREFQLLEQIAVSGRDARALARFYQGTLALFVHDMKQFLGDAKHFAPGEAREAALMCMATLQGLTFLQHTGLAGGDVDGAYRLFRRVLELANRSK